MALVPATKEQLQWAAEQTISAAAAALLWAGEDSHGVLAHVAGTTASEMVKSRQAYTVLARGRNFVAADAQEGFDEELSCIVQHPCFEVAALPAVAVPEWARRMSEAISEASRDKEPGWCSDSHGIVMRHPDAAIRDRALRGSVRYHALHTCGFWGQDPLPLNLIEVGARAVLSTAGYPLTTSRFEF
jgi:hypothetical protein